jgi:hypothetical protein
MEMSMYSTESGAWSQSSSMFSESTLKSSDSGMMGMSRESPDFDANESLDKTLIASDSIYSMESTDSNQSKKHSVISNDPKDDKFEQSIAEGMSKQGDDEFKERNQSWESVENQTQAIAPSDSNLNTTSQCFPTSPQPPQQEERILYPSESAHSETCYCGPDEISTSDAPKESMDRRSLLRTSEDFLSAQGDTDFEDNKEAMDTSD